ncbi:MAG: Na+/H+ antiporter subunit E [Oceanipulchritudo sp.]
MRSAILHLAISLTWLFLSPQRDLPQFLKGLVIGYGILLLFQPLLPKDRYLKAGKAFLFWIVAFGRALVLSQIRVAKLILFPRRYPVHPGFLQFPIDGLSDLEILILSHSITLTPGTTSVEVDPEKQELLVHALEADDPQETIRDIKENLLKPLLAFTRP